MRFMCAKKKSKNKKNRNSKSKKKSAKKNPDVWTEEEYEAYLCGLYGLECIVDYTPGGFPIGLPIEEESSFLDDEDNEADENNVHNDEDIPF